MILSAEQLGDDDSSDEQRRILRRRAAHAVHIGVLGCGITAYFEREASAALLRNRYRSLPHRGGPLRAHVACDDDGITHFLSGSDAYVWPHSTLTDRGTAFLADAVITDALLRSIPATVTLHAAALNHDGAAFAITGVSTAGKTTTAIACVAAGCAIYSDERCIVTRAGVVPYPRALNVRAESLDLLRATLPESAVVERLREHSGREWRDASLADLFGVRDDPAPAPLRAIFCIRGHAGEPQTRRISPVEMLPYAQIGAASPTNGLDHLAALLETLSGAACFELVLGSPHDTGLHVREVLERLGA